MVPSTRKLLTASGQELRIVGSFFTLIKIQGRQHKAHFSVIDGVNQECIIGNDIMQQMGVTIDLSKKKIMVPTKKDAPKEVRAIVSKAVTIPPRSIRVVKFKVDNVEPGSCCVVEKETCCENSDSDFDFCV